MEHGPLDNYLRRELHSRRLVEEAEARRQQEEKETVERNLNGTPMEDFLEAADVQLARQFLERMEGADWPGIHRKYSMEERWTQPKRTWLSIHLRPPKPPERYLDKGNLLVEGYPIGCLVGEDDLPWSAEENLYTPEPNVYLCPDGRLRLPTGHGLLPRHQAPRIVFGTKLRMMYESTYYGLPAYHYLTKAADGFGEVLAKLIADDPQSS